MKEVKLNQIIITGTNPRKHFDAERHKELVASIRSHGILNPLLVREKNGGLNQFELICGECRFRAAKELKLDTVPVFVQEMSDLEVLEAQLIENMQRSDLTPLEEAEAFRSILSDKTYTQQNLAVKIGKTQGYISARLSLLDLREDFRTFLAEGKLQPGHIKSLLIVKGCEKLLDHIKKELEVSLDGDQEITVKNFDALVNRVCINKTKPLYKLDWGSDSPKFDMKPCAACTFRKSFKFLHDDKPEFRCFNPDCWKEKQTTVSRAESERLRDKIKKGKVVDEDAIPQDACHLENVSFDLKTCAKCEHRKVAVVKDYYGKNVKKEICLNKECFDKKTKAQKEAEKKAEQEAFHKKVNQCKQKACKAKIDDAFLLEILLAQICFSFQHSIQDAVATAYSIPVSILRGPKNKAREYFTRNTKVDVDEILLFIRYWRN